MEKKTDFVWGKTIIRVKQILRQQFWGSQMLGSNFIGVPKMNGVCALWENEDPLWRMQYCIFHNLQLNIIFYPFYQKQTSHKRKHWEGDDKNEKQS